MYSICFTYSGVRSPEIFAVVAVYFLKLGNKATSFNLDIFYILISLLLLLCAVSWTILIKSKNSKHYFSLKDSSTLQIVEKFAMRKSDNDRCSDNNYQNSNNFLNFIRSHFTSNKKLDYRTKINKIDFNSGRLNTPIKFTNKFAEASFREALLPGRESKYLKLNNGGEENNEEYGTSDNDNNNDNHNEILEDKDNDNYIVNKNNTKNKLKVNLPKEMKSKETIINDYYQCNKINILCLALFIIMFCSIFQASFFVFVSSSVEGRDIEQILYFDRLFADLLGRPLTRLKRPSFLKVFHII